MLNEIKTRGDAAHAPANEYFRFLAAAGMRWHTLAHGICDMCTHTHALAVENTAKEPGPRLCFFVLVFVARALNQILAPLERARTRARARYMR